MFIWPWTWKRRALAAEAELESSRRLQVAMHGAMQTAAEDMKRLTDENTRLKTQVRTMSER